MCLALRLLFILCPIKLSDRNVDLIYLALQTICESNENCTAALTAMNANTNCANTINNDINAVECSGSCRTLITTALDTCPTVGNIIY